MILQNPTSQTPWQEFKSTLMPHVIASRRTKQPPRQKFRELTPREKMVAVENTVFATATIAGIDALKNTTFYNQTLKQKGNSFLEALEATSGSNWSVESSDQTTLCTELVVRFLRLLFRAGDNHESELLVDTIENAVRPLGYTLIGI